MSSSMHGKNTSDVEVTNVSGHGIWLLASGCEHFLAYDDFPWFRDASISEVLNVVEPSAGHFHWPDLDIDLSLASIEKPDKFPLRSK